MPIRISGLNSGLDTESIVGALVSSYSYKKDKYVKAQTKLSWKQDAWKELNTKVYSLYTSVGTMRYSSDYSLKKATVSDSSKAKVTAAGGAINGTQSLEITQLAKTAYITGGQLANNITGDSTLSALGVKFGEKEKGSIQVRTSTGTKNIEVDSTTTINSFVNKLNEAGVQANFDEKNHRIFVSSKNSGRAGDFSVSANNSAGLKSLTKLGLLSNTEVESVTSTAIGASMAYKSYYVGSTSVAVGSADSFARLITKIKDAKATLADENADEDAKAEATAFLDDPISTLISNIESKFAGKSYTVTETDDQGNETQVTKYIGKATTEGDTTTYSIDWDELSEEEITQIGKMMYESEDAKYDSDAQTYTSQQITKSINAIRDCYLKMEKIKHDTSYESETEREEAYAAAKAELTTVLQDPENKKWNDFIESNFGSVNSESDSSYSNFWVQSDNLELAQSVYYRVNLAADIAYNNATFEVDKSLEAIKVDGQDSIIKLNGVEYSSSSSSVTVNNVTVEALALTAKDAPITFTVSTDTDGLYDKIKDFLTSYNNLMNEMQKLYNADSAKDYEPLTDDEKKEMSENEIEKWEEKIKSSLLRRDSSLSSIISTMTMSMMSVYEINGQKVSWSTYGIHTLGTLNAEKNEGYAYHIDGDSEDSKTSGKEEKLRKALSEDPESVIEFVKQMAHGLYKSLDEKMKSTSVKSVYTVYNDKEMASEYSDYSKLIKTWTDRITDMEDSYYKKFAKMESALAKLQSNSSSITQMLGGG